MHKAYANTITPVRQYNLCMCFSAWARRMLRIIAVRRWMHLWERVFGLVQGACPQWFLLRGDAFICGSLCLGVYNAHAQDDCCEAMHACVGVCLGLYKAHAHGDCCEAMHVCACLCVHMNEAYAHGDCCKAMHACASWCAHEQGVCSRWLLRGNACVCVWVCTRRMLTVIAARLCMFAVVCVFVPYEAICTVCAPSLLLLKHQDSCVDDLMFDFMNFVLCRNSTGWIVVW